MSRNPHDPTIAAAALAAAVLAGALTLAGGWSPGIGVVVWLIITGVFVAIERPPGGPN
jgi:hypothetical protein